MRQILSLCKLEQVLEAHMAAWTSYAALGKQSHMRVPGIHSSVRCGVPTPGEWALAEPPLSGDEAAAQT